MNIRIPVVMVAVLAAFSVAGCSIKSDSGDDKKDSGQVTTPTQPQNTTPQNTTPQNTTPTTPQDTTPTTTTPDTSGRTETTDINGIILTVRRYFDAGRKGNATEWCGQQSDRLLQKNFGGLSDCISSEVANKADADIPPGRNLDFDNSISLDGDDANATPSTISGSTTYDIDLVYEGENGGWAVDNIKRK
jgi:hypothetical protein